MFLIFCSRSDREAIWLYEQVTRSGCVQGELLFAEDLYSCSDWLLRINDQTAFAAVTLPDARVVSTANVTLFINRVQFLDHPAWRKKGPVEQQYFQQEWNAFLLGWLKAFEPVLINKPLPLSLAGYMPPPLRWQLLAQQCGFTIRPQHFSSGAVDFNRLYAPCLPADAQSLLFFNGKTYTSMCLAGLSEACSALARKAGCSLLEVFVSRGEDGRPCFLHANSMPAFSTHPAHLVNAITLMAMRRQGIIPAPHPMAEAAAFSC